MAKYVETRYPRPTSFEGQESLLPRQRKLWMKIKRAKLFEMFKHSRLNPYHFGLMHIKAQNLEEAREIARKNKQARFVYNGIRYSAESDCSIAEEMKKDNQVLRGHGDVSHLIPRDKNGNPDLLAEEPIVISIIPLEGISLTGHISMQYKDRVINRILDSINMEPLYPRYQYQAEYYFVYPSHLGIDPEKLIREMDKHNIKYGEKEYSIRTNNCAKNVAQVLKKVGVKDINFFGIDRLGLVFPTPGNNPFHFGFKDWCLRHGVLVHLEEIALLYKYHDIPHVEQRRMEFKTIRTRYEKFKEKLDKRVLIFQKLKGFFGKGSIKKKNGHSR